MKYSDANDKGLWLFKGDGVEIWLDQKRCCLSHQRSSLQKHQRWNSLCEELKLPKGNQTS